jgi:protein-disulfide isomerase
MDQAAYDACHANQTLREKIATGAQQGKEVYKVDSTPTFFINGEKHTGDLPIDDLAKMIEPYLKAG